MGAEHETGGQGQGQDESTFVEAVRTLRRQGRIGITFRRAELQRELHGRFAANAINSMLPGYAVSEDAWRRGERAPYGVQPVFVRVDRGLYMLVSEAQAELLGGGGGQATARSKKNLELQLDAPLYERARRVAEQRGQTLQRLMTEAMQAYLGSEGGQTGAVAPLEIPAFGSATARTSLSPAQVAEIGLDDELAVLRGLDTTARSDT